MDTETISAIWWQFHDDIQALREAEVSRKEIEDELRVILDEYDSGDLW